ncbi:MAG: hypothetical protein RRZ83_00105 [Alistipes sp.]
MKKLHLFKLLFAAMFVMAATAFTACSDDDEGTQGGTVTLDVAPTALAFDEAGGAKTFTITTNGAWKIKGAEGAAWLAVTPALSGTGNQTITVTVGQSAEPHKISLTVAAYTQIFGFEKEVAKQVVEISQTPGGVPPSGEVIYGNNFDKAKVEKGDKGWPFLDQTEVWQNATGTGNSTVTYAYTNMSVRSSGKLSGGYEGASGVNKIFFGKAPASFEIKDITLPANATKFALTVGVSRSLNVNGTYDNIFKPENFKIELGNGAGWANVTYAKTAGDDTKDPFWVYLTANFTLSAPMSKVTVKFTATESSCYSIDDVKLTEGVGGQTINLGDAPEPGEAIPIANITTGMNCAAEGVIVATTTRSFLVKDNTGTILVYVGKDHTNAVGDKVKVAGLTTEYGGLIQFGAEATTTKLGMEAVTQPTPTVMDGAAMDAYAKAVKISYIQYTGVLTINGDYYNVAVDGATIQGSLSYPAAEMVPASFNGAKVVVTGYAIGTTAGGRYLATAVTAIKLAEGQDTPAIVSVTPAKLSFAAAGESKTAEIVVRNATGLKFKAIAEAPFTASITGQTVTVVAPANTTAAAISKTLTIQLLNADQSVADTQTVALTQAAAGSGAADYTLISTLADLKAGTYYMAGFRAKGEAQSGNADSPNPAAENYYGVWTGVLADGKDCETVKMSFLEGALTSIDTEVTAAPADIKLVAVDGKVNTYYIMLSDKYLAGGAKSRSLTLGATQAEWVFSEVENRLVATSGTTTLQTVDKSGKSLIRNYSKPNQGAHGLYFFAKE